jgi:1-acyl-sn-glycerol-3-phosphate acyltransferase
VLCAALPRRLTFVAKSDYFARGGAGTWLYGTLCRLTGQIPISREGAGSAATALTAGHGVLRCGGVWATYPEGTRSPDGRLWRGRTGAMRVALQGAYAVVPVGVLGTRSINHPGRRGWRRGRVEIRIGAPLDLATWSDSASEPQSWRAATDELMATIQRMTGQEYIDRFPTSAERAWRDAA